jgi:hypothetical protein
MYELTRLAVAAFVLWAIWQVFIGAGTERECAEWSFECPAPVAEPVRAEVNLAG